MITNKIYIMYFLLWTRQKLSKICFGLKVWVPMFPAVLGAFTGRTMRLCWRLCFCEDRFTSEKPNDKA